MTDLRRVLIIDDEPSLLSGLNRLLGERFDISTADGGEVALAKVQNDGPFAVVVCDMRMPGMDGVEVLRRLTELAPDTVRIMLTGNADQKTAVEAINRGNIFRFYSKPVPMAVLGDGIEAGIEQHRLITAEKRLLEQTLAGSVAMLVDVLGMVAPDAFQRSRRVRDWAGAVARQMRIDQPWVVELAAELAHLGAIAVPPEVLARYQAGQDLTPIESEMIGRIPEIGAGLIRKVPRLEAVADAIQHQARWHRDNPPLAASILNLLLNLDAIGNGQPSKEALERLASQRGRFDPAVVSAVSQAIIDMAPLASAQTKIKVDIPASDLRVGDVLESDIRLDSGRLVLAAGETISEPLFLRLQNVRRMAKLHEPIRVSRIGRG